MCQTKCLIISSVIVDASTERRIVTLDNSKLAVLLFEEVLPLNLMLETMSSGDVFDVSAVKQLLTNIIPARLNNPSAIKDVFQVNLFIAANMYHVLSGNDASISSDSKNDLTKFFASISEELIEMGYPSTLLRERWIDLINRLFDQHPGFESAPILSTKSASKLDSQEPSPLFAISNIKIIDTSKVSWRKIFEFRKDDESASKLRRFRLFVAENYKGKSKSFIEDDLHNRIEAYEDTIKKWNFETYNGAAHSILTSKLLAGAGTASMISTLVGAPLPAILSAVGGISVELGKLTLSLSKRKHDLRHQLKQNPIAYLVKASSDLPEDR